MSQNNIEAIYPLSPMQQGILFHTIYEPGSGDYIVQLSWRCFGKLDLSAFERAWKQVIARHSVLRTSFIWKRQGEPLQVVHRQVQLVMELLDWRGLDEIQRRQQMESRLGEDRSRGFELQQAPLMRVQLAQIEEQSYWVGWSSHHLLLDGWSLPLLVKEVFRYYEAYSQGRELELAASRPYEDYIGWLGQQDMSQAETYWRQRLAGFTEPTPLPLRRSAGEQANEGGYAEQKLELSAELTEQLGRFSRRQQVTINTVAQAAWVILLSRYSGESDVVYGATVSGRPAELAGVEEMVGLFINTLPVRVQVRPEQKLGEWLQQLQSEQAELRQYEYSPLVEVQGWSDVPRGRALFESIVLFENYPVSEAVSEQNNGLRISNLRAVEQNNFPITVAVVPASRLGVMISYYRDQFASESIGRLLTHLQRLLESMTADSEQRVDMVQMLSAEETQQVLLEWNDTAAAYPADKSIHRLFEEQVERTPDAVAVVYQLDQLTYRELNSRANQLAYRLRQLGAGPDKHVGIFIERSVEMVVGLLGILKADAAYVPLDPTYPGKRLAYMLADAEVEILVSQSHLLDRLPEKDAAVVCLDTNWPILSLGSPANPESVAQAAGDNLAYVIYTSGSTGQPKGVMVTHRNVVNFFTAMDARIGEQPIGAWLAVTSISFDISVLELLWTLTRGFEVVVQSEHVEDLYQEVAPAEYPNSSRKIDFSLFYFASDDQQASHDKYRLLLEGAKFADQHGFAAVWTPERHFHAFGGLYPNPSVTSAAIAALTERIRIRAGSVVLPLHNPIRVAEEWSVVDNISKGRVGISFATGWTAEDFALAPENYADRKAVMFRQIEIVQRLWRGEGVPFRSGAGEEAEVRILPKPIQGELPVWITAAGNPETFRMAGEIGANLLTHLLGQSLEELAAKIAVYRQAWRQPAHAVADGKEGGHVTLMLHTFIGPDLQAVREKVRQPFYNYLRTSIDLIANLARTFGLDINSKEFTESDMQALLAHAFDRYFDSSGLMGTPESCREMINSLKAIGVDEVGCLIDFGVDVESVMASLHYLDVVRKQSNETDVEARPDYSFAAQLARRQVSYLQCTPSLAKILILNANAASGLASLRLLLIGGEALPASLAEELHHVTPAAILNMYGPTETTIWSTTHRLQSTAGPISIGKPIANTEIFILDGQGHPTPVGVAGELLIGGAGVVRGYLGRPNLTAEKFVPNPFSSSAGARLYRTGDLARYQSNGDIEFLGRMDQQVKLRGHRIELEEIETLLNAHPAVRESVVTAREQSANGNSLNAYLVAVPGQTLSSDELRHYLKQRLPEYMVPGGFRFLDALPLTPNGKVDRRALSSLASTAVEQNRSFTTPRSPTEEILAGIWCEVLNLPRVGVHDNFFDLGGHSLLAVLVVSRVRQWSRIELPLRKVFEGPTIAEMAQSIEEAVRTGADISLPPIKPASRDQQLPLSFAQQRLWFLSQLEPENAAYNVPAVLRLTGSLDVTAMQQALSEVVRRHESLRTTFSSVGGQPLQIIGEPATLPLPVTDLSHLPEEERDQQRRQLVAQEAELPFDLAEGPLIRVNLLRLGEADHVLILIMHQIVCDGWSMSVFTRELAVLYAAFLAGAPSPLPDLHIQYADFALWQRESLQGELLSQQLAYWKQQLTEAPPVLDLPTDRPRPLVQSYRGARHLVAFSPATSQQLTEFSRSRGVTVFMSLLAAFYVWLFRYSGQPQIVVGTLLANRMRSELEPLIGFFLNAQPLSTHLSPLMTWKDLLDRVREVALGAFSHQDVPFEKLVEELHPDRTISHHPIFQVMLVLQNAPREELQLPGLTLRSVEVDARAAVVDVTLSLGETEHGLGGWFEYNTDLFDVSTISRMAMHYQRLIEAMLSQPEQRITQARMLSDAERNQILRQWNATAREYPDDSGFPELFAAQVNRTPAAIAVRCGSQTMSYGELNRRADEVARGLRAQGIEAEQLVAILMERGIQFLIAMLGILKAGAAYLPLDVLSPIRRLGRALRRSGTRIVVVDDSWQRQWGQVQDELTAAGLNLDVLHLNRLSGEQQVGVDEQRTDPETVLQAVCKPPLARNLAYVIYTSGSTGEPKGVMIEQRGMINHLGAKINDLELSPRDVVAQTASASFDISVWQFLAALLVGGEVLIINDEVAHDGSRLMKEVRERGVTVWETVPSMLNAVLQLEENWTPPATAESQVRGVEAGALRWLVVTGEALSAELVERWQRRYRHVAMVNAYGPTECSDDVTHEFLRGDEFETAGGRVAIGRPVQNTQLYVVDEEMGIVPVGVHGEVCIGGIGVGRGYLGDAVQTAEVFTPDPYTENDGGRLYRTGDIGRYLADGRVEYLGRRDEQVKVRGYRIELGEVEAVLREHRGVIAAVAVVRGEEGGEKRIVAYVVGAAAGEGMGSGESAALGVREFREYLKERLPEYMVPSAIVQLAELPLTPNGKVDRLALPAPAPASSGEQESYVAPQGTIEEMLAGIWIEVLHVLQVSRHDNFFDLGGHSLLATQVISRVRQRFQVELPLRTMFEAPTVAQSAESIAQALETGAGLSVPPIGRVSREQPLPLSFAQQRLWFLDQLEPGSTVYNLPLALRVEGHLDAEALQWGLNQIIQRHEALRTTFHSVQGEAIQVIASEAAVNLPLIDLSGLAAAEREAEAHRLVLEESGRGFDLAQGPLLRTKLLRLSDDEHILLLTMHHIISDAWSTTMLVREAVTLYEAFRTGEPSPLPELPVQYADYAVWQREWLQGTELEKQLSYWREQFRDGVPVLELPTDKARPAALSHRGAALPFKVDDQVAECLKALCKQQGVTLFMTLLAAWQTLLGRYSGQEELVVGADMANRNRAETEELIGFFVNMLVLRADLRGDPSFLALLERVRASCLGAYAHQDLPFEKLVDELAPDRDLSHSPLFQVAFVLQNVPQPDQSIAGVRIKTVRVETKTTPFDLLLSMSESGEDLDGLIIFNTDLFQTQTVERLANHFKRLLAGIVLDPGQRIWSLPLLSEVERRQILLQANQGGQKYPSRQRLDQLFQLQAERAPEAVALVMGQEQVSYRELNRRANQMAHYLQERGVGPDVMVGMLMAPSVEMLIGILGILKAGGAYLPLDPQYPSERLSFILDDAQVRLLLTEHRLGGQVPDQSVELLYLDSDWPSIAAHSQEEPANLTTPDNLAYVIYTSGSTGKPKGVLVTHANVARLFSATQEWFNFNGDDVWTLFHSYAFDFSVWEIWGALLYGGRLVIVSPLVSRSPEAFYELLVAERVTVLNQTPSAFRQLMRAEESWRGGEELSLRLVIFGGEALETGSLRAWFERHGDEHPQLVNMYGITETTVHVTYHPITVAEIEEVGASLIGRPIGDLELYVLDREIGLVPGGVYGEMYVGGAGLARNYLNRPELTAERFVPHPYSGSRGERLYRSGDLARYRRDGELEYVGRIDDQVKVRGFRIELGEVEATLGKHQGVRDCVVVAREDMPGDKRLVAYLVAEQEFATTVSELRRYLLEKLPEYMVPGVYVMLSEMPLTPNGKINRRLLPAPEQARPELTESFIAPRTRTERLLADVWSEVLQVTQVGIHDNFFDLGGDSILSIKALAKAQEHGLNFSVQQLFQHATVYKLSQSLLDEQSIAREPTTPFSLISAEDRQQLPEDVEDAYPLTMLQGGMIFHSEYSPETAVYHDIFCYELRAPFNLGAMRAAIQEMIRRHAVLRTSFDLASYSEPLQLVHREIEALIEYADLSGLDAAAKQAALDELIATEKQRPFRWDQPPLLRVLLHRRSADVFQFALSFHHVLFDGWSLATLLNGIFLHYWYLLGKTKNDIEAAPKLAFREFVALEREAIESSECQQYWQNQLADCSITLLPRWSTGGRQTAERTVGRRNVIVTATVSDGLRSLARMAGAPLKSVLLGAHLRVLSLLTGQPDVTTGLACNGRPEESGGEQVIGLFLNPVPFRQQLRGGTWDELVREVFAAEQEMLAYRRYPLVELKRRQGGESLFEVEFNFVNFHVLKGALQLDGIELIRETTIEETNLTLLVDIWVQLQTSQVKMELMYDAGQLTEDQISGIVGYYRRVLEAMASEPLARYEAVSLLSEQEKRQLLVEWNQTRRDYPRNSCIHQLFEAQVERSPDVVALVFDDQRLTYSELNRRANQLAHHLRHIGFASEAAVGVCLERSAEMVIAMLAILKAGAAYLPLDSTFPTNRLAFMIADADVSLVITQSQLVKNLPEQAAQLLCLDTHWHIMAERSADNLSAGSSAMNLAYIIYTSGSTGMPKGICIVHRSVNRLVCNTDYVQLEASDRVAQASNAAFDAATFEVWGALLNGACLVGVKQDLLLSPPEFAAQLKEHRITVLFLTTALFNQMVREEPTAFCGLRYLLFGGQAVEPRWVAEVLRQGYRGRLLHVYGPTESTTYSTWHEVGEVAGTEATIPIGRPIANTEVYLLDGRLAPVPVGVTGELYVGGDGLARDYLKRPALTAERFIPNPHSRRPGSRLYMTGDLARYRTDGEIEFIGRRDHQIKLRGFRVEVEEISVILAAHPEVEEAVVVAREDDPGEKRLVAYIVGAQSPVPSTGELRSYLKQKLPEYMIPSAFVWVEKIPLTSNGKIDRRALPAPEFSVESRGRAFVPPRTPIEEMVSAIWSEVLKVEQIGAHDDFFELGGHSLLATQVISRMRNVFRMELPLRTLFEHPTVAGMAACISAASNSDRPEVPQIPRRKGEGPFPLSFAQQRLWFFDQLHPGNVVYNIPFALHVAGPLNIGALEQTLSEVVRRHEVLRTNFGNLNGRATQIISPAQGLSLPITDLSQLTEAERDKEAKLLAMAEAHTPFDLAAGSLLRVKALRLDDQEHVLLVTMHHIVSDGWSMGVLTREVGVLYEAYAGGGTSPLEELEIQYADYAVWQREWLQGELLDRELGYWKQQLAGAPTVLELPTDRPRPPVQSYRGAYESVILNQSTAAALRALIRREGVTLFMALLSALQVLLSRYTGQSDVVVGTPIANRTRSETEGLIGFFLNMLAMRTDLAGEPSWHELLQRVREVCLGAYAHQDVPFERLVDEIQPERNLSHAPLFQVMLVLQNAPQQELELQGLTLSGIPSGATSTKFDLTLSVEESGGELRGSIGYRTDLFDAETIARLSLHYQRLLAEMAADPQQLISRAQILTEAERQQVLRDWNQTHRDYELDGCLHELFEAQVERTPEAMAASNEDSRLSYRELNSRANQLARYLRKRGVGAESVVGLCLERSVEMVVALLGVLKAGGAYLPLDASAPAARLFFMMKDAGARLVVTEHAVWTAIKRPVQVRPDLAVLLELQQVPETDEPEIEVVWLDDEWPAISAESSENPGAPLEAANLAYVIYTSGSTGRPKGVMIEHRQMVNYLKGISERVGLHGGSRYLMVQPLSVDSSATTIFPSLTAGGCLHVLKREQVLDATGVARYMKEQQIDCLKIAPSHLKALEKEVGVEALMPREQLIIGGEAAQWEFVRRLQRGAGTCRIYNHYGPTEATVGVLVKDIGRINGSVSSNGDGADSVLARSNDGPGEKGVVGLGRGLANVRVYVVDDEMEAVAVGVVGELYLGGACVGRGYLGRSKLTAELFVPNPYSEVGGERLYRTGDMARYGKDGEIEYVGRRDEQVKVRGHRIELGEIEGLLSELEWVQEAVVVVREDDSGEPLIIAYVVLDEAPEADQRRDLRQYLKERLPDYMMPSAIAHLAEMPLTAHGKVDRRALPAPSDGGLVLDRTYVAPRNQIEEILAGIWSRLLGVEQIGIHDNFFELGGHSLLATQVVARARAAFRVELPLPIVFEQPTIAGLAEAVRGAEAGMPAIVPVPRENRRVKRPKPAAKIPLETSK